MKYCIKNQKNIYIRLNENGTPVTCSKSMCGEFAESKAKNILSCLPKTLRQMSFEVIAIPDIKPKIEGKREKIIQSETYAVSEDVRRWVDKFGICSDILEEAKQRENELIIALENVDNELLNILHSIELEKSKDMYNGWKQYRSIKENREKRRQCKDELLIVQDVLKEINPNYLHRDRVQKAIDGLLKRKYVFRVVEDN